MKLFGTAAILTAFPLTTSSMILQNNDRDTVIISATNAVSPLGTEDAKILKDAPIPNFILNGEEKKAIIVVDISKNILYKYDDEGNAKVAYLICSGKPSTPTHTGIRYITHIEKYPYKLAPSSSKRRKNPNNYGPRIICLDKVDINSGERSSIGEFIHGNNNADSIGKYASQGCIRMDNTVIKKLSQEVKKGQYVKIID